jgi:hypothetical protein
MAKTSSNPEPKVANKVMTKAPSHPPVVKPSNPPKAPEQHMSNAPSHEMCHGVRSIVDGKNGTKNGKAYTAQDDANSKCCSKNALLITKDQYLCQ